MLTEESREKKEDKGVVSLKSNNLLFLINLQKFYSELQYVYHLTDFS